MTKHSMPKPLRVQKWWNTLLVLGWRESFMVLSLIQCLFCWGAINHFVFHTDCLIKVFLVIQIFHSQCEAAGEGWAQCLLYLLTILSCPWAHLWCDRLHLQHWHLVSWMCACRTAAGAAHLPWRQWCGPASGDHKGKPNPLLLSCTFRFSPTLLDKMIYNDKKKKLRLLFSKDALLLLVINLKTFVMLHKIKISNECCPF